LDPQFQFWGTFPPKQGARKASHTIFRPSGGDGRIKERGKELDHQGKPT